MFSVGLLIQTRRGKPIPGTPLRLNLRKECAHRGTVYDRASLTSSSQGTVCFYFYLLTHFYFLDQNNHIKPKFCFETEKSSIPQVVADFVDSYRSTSIAI